MMGIARTITGIIAIVYIRHFPLNLIGSTANNDILGDIVTDINVLKSTISDGFGHFPTSIIAS